MTSDLAALRHERLKLEFIGGDREHIKLGSLCKMVALKCDQTRVIQDARALATRVVGGPFDGTMIVLRSQVPSSLEDQFRRSGCASVTFHSPSNEFTRQELEADNHVFGKGAVRILENSEPISLTVNTVEDLRDVMTRLSINPSFISICVDSHINIGTLVITKNENWEVCYSERGERHELRSFEIEGDACRYFIDLIARDLSYFQYGMLGPRD